MPPAARPNQSPAPPPYSELGRNVAQEGNDVDDLADEVFRKLDLSFDSEVPTEDQCLAHLRLLHAFHRLKIDVSTTDGLFGLYNEDVTANLSKLGANADDVKKNLLTSLEEKRWAVYVTRAVDRFASWWTLLKEGCSRLTWASMEPVGSPYCPPEIAARFGNVLQASTKFRLSEQQLPPLDVLMVWHSYSLNPRVYLEDCLLDGACGLWEMGFPWQKINTWIDVRSGEYNPPAATKAAFEQHPHLTWNNLDSPDTCLKTCPNIYCRKPVTVPYTTINRLDIINWVKDTTIGIVDGMPGGYGYADKELFITCQECHMGFDHEFLRASKFIEDYNRALNPPDERQARPMRGCVLTKDGLIQQLQHDSGTVRACDSRTFPHRFLKAMSAHNITLWTAVSLDMIRNSVQEGLRSAELRQTLKIPLAVPPTTRSQTIFQEDRFYIRRMMSRYWGNSSPFGLDLVAAVMRQGIFIEKMEAIDWLHSPAARSTMARLITQYKRFIQIMALHPTQMVVPTVAVDLAWHTHQLNSWSYYSYTVKHTNTFVDHDDKIPEMSLNAAFQRTSKIYQDMFKEPYSECICWYCEALRASYAPLSFSSLLISSKIPSDEASLFDAKNPATSDPEKGPHISAHNAVRPKLPAPGTREYELYVARLKMTEKNLTAAYQRACKRAAKQRRPIAAKPRFPDPDLRHRESTTNISPGPTYFGLATYFPFAVCEYNSECPSDVSHINPAFGAVGNCVAHTCGVGVAAGGCAGAGHGSHGGGCGGAGGGGGCAGAGNCGGGGGGGGGCSGGGGGGCGGGGGGGN